MKKRSLLVVILILILILILIIISISWIMSEKSDSYSEPQEALFAIDNELLLIPSYEINDKALYFFIKDTNNIGATYVQEGLFGWKVGMLTWSPMDNLSDNESLNGYQVHGENLIYGLIRHGDERLIRVGENEASILNLAMLSPNEVGKFRLEGLYIWYFESETPFKGVELKLFNKNTGEELDTINY